MKLMPVERHLYTKIEQFRKNYPLVPFTKIGIALSGGADSMALFIAFHRLKTYGLLESSIIAIYIRHNLRPRDETLTEEALILDITTRKSVPLFIVEGQISHHNGKGIEENAREYRYGLFRYLVHEQNLNLILTGHHAKDEAETMIYRLSSGAGYRTTQGIPEYRHPYFRPCIDLIPQVLQDYLRSVGVPWSEDTSNSDQDIPRNRIRHSILPEIEKLQPGFYPNILNSKKKSFLLSDFINKEVSVHKWQEMGDAVLQMDSDVYYGLHPFLRYELLLFATNKIVNWKNSDCLWSMFDSLYDSRSSRKHRISLSYFEPFLVPEPQLPIRVQGHGLQINWDKKKITLSHELVLSQKYGYCYRIDKDMWEPIVGGFILGTSYLETPKVLPLMVSEVDSKCDESHYLIRSWGRLDTAMDLFPRKIPRETRNKIKNTQRMGGSMSILERNGIPILVFFPDDTTWSVIKTPTYQRETESFKTDTKILCGLLAVMEKDSERE